MHSEVTTPEVEIMEQLPAVVSLFEGLAQVGSVAEPSARTVAFNQRLEVLEGRLLELGMVDMPAKHVFAPGVYFREGVIPAGCFVLGHAHRDEHLTVFYKGRALFCMDGKVQVLEGPCVVRAAPGVRKVAYVLEELAGANIHANPDDCRDIARLEERLLIKSETYKAFHRAKELSCCN